MRVVTETIYKTKYEAYDGTRFDNESDCIEYENNIRTVVEAWKKIPKLEYSEESLHLGGGYSDMHYVVYCRNQRDIDAANAYFKECGGTNVEKLDESYIRKRAIVSVWEIDNAGLGEGVVIYGTPMDVIKDMRDMLYAPIPEIGNKKLYNISADYGNTWITQYLCDIEAEDHIKLGYLVKEVM